MGESLVDMLLAIAAIVIPLWLAYLWTGQLDSRGKKENEDKSNAK